MITGKLNSTQCHYHYKYTINNNDTEVFQVVVQPLPEYHPQLICTDPECDQSPSHDYSSSSSCRPLPTNRPNNNYIS